jgi:hypothetical protein
VIRLRLLWPVNPKSEAKMGSYRGVLNPRVGRPTRQAAAPTAAAGVPRIADRGKSSAITQSEVSGAAFRRPLQFQHSIVRSSCGAAWPSLGSV